MQIIQIVGQILHLLVIAIAAAGPLLCIPLNAKQLNRKDPAERNAYWSLGTTLNRHAIIALILGSVFGLIIAALVWNPDFHQRCHILKTRFMYAGIEWIFSFVLLLITHRWWLKRPDGLKPFVFRSLLIILATTNLLYHFPIIFMLVHEVPATIVAELESTGAELSRAQFYEYAFSKSMLARWLHIVISMVMLSFAYLAVISLRSARDTNDLAQDTAVRTVNWAARNVLILLFTQIGFGLMALLTMKNSELVMGGDPVVTALFAGGMCLMLLQMQQWTALMSRKIDPQAVARAVTTLIALFSCMTAVSILS
ncbi:MAG: hypothetical protein OSA92_11030 [Pirellulaceae bacterium]|nr:hypothetical protein [Pirellulaceae bacterium]